MFHMTDTCPRHIIFTDVGHGLFQDQILDYIKNLLVMSIYMYI